MVAIRLEEVKAVLLRLLRKQDDSCVPALMLWGPPGVGKSHLVKQVARELGRAVLDVRLSLLNPVDLRGVPVVNRESGRTEWFPPAWLPDARRHGEKGILFLDEIVNCPPAVQSAALQLVLDRQLGEYGVPDGWVLIAAGNRGSDRAGVYQMSAALANRFLHLPVASAMPSLELPAEGVDVNLEDWKCWAYGAGIHPNVVAFLNYRPHLLWRATGQVAYATPRAWEFASRVLDAFEDVQEARPAIAGCVGEGPAAEFVAFVSSAADMPDPARILAGEDVPAPARPDVTYALCGAIVHRLARLSRSKQERAADSLFGWVTRLPVEFQILLFKDAFSARLGNLLISRPAWSDWATRHGAVFGGVP